MVNAKRHEKHCCSSVCRYLYVLVQNRGLTTINGDVKGFQSKDALRAQKDSQSSLKKKVYTSGFIAHVGSFKNERKNQSFANIYDL